MKHLLIFMHYFVLLTGIVSFISFLRVYRTELNHISYAFILLFVTSSVYIAITTIALYIQVNHPADWISRQTPMYLISFPVQSLFMFAIVNIGLAFYTGNKKIMRLITAVFCAAYLILSVLFLNNTDLVQWTPVFRQPVGWIRTGLFFLSFIPASIVIPRFYIKQKNPFDMNTRIINVFISSASLFFMVSAVLSIIFPLFYALFPLFYHMILITITIIAYKTYRSISSIDLEILKKYNISTREKEILSLMIQGLSYLEMEKKLCISLATIKSHIKSIFKKTHTGNKYEVVALITQNPLTPAEEQSEVEK